MSGATYFRVTGTTTTVGNSVTVSTTALSECPPVCTGISIYRSLNSAQEACCSSKGNTQYFNDTTVGTATRFYGFDSGCATLHSGTAYIMAANELGYYYTFVNGIKTAGPTLCPNC